MCQCWIVCFFFFSTLLMQGIDDLHEDVTSFSSLLFFCSIIWSFWKPFYHTAGRMMCSSVASSCDQWCIIEPWGLWSSRVAHAQLCQFIENLAICSILEHKCDFICMTLCKCLSDWLKCVKILLMSQEVCEERKFFNRWSGRMYCIIGFWFFLLSWHPDSVFSCKVFFFCLWRGENAWKGVMFLLEQTEINRIIRNIEGNYCFWTHNGFRNDQIISCKSVFINLISSRFKISCQRNLSTLMLCKLILALPCFW